MYSSLYFLTVKMSQNGKSQGKDCFYFGGIVAPQQEARYPSAREIWEVETN